LLGLIRDGEGLAIKVLKSMDIDIILLRKAIEDSILHIVPTLQEAKDLVLMDEIERSFNDESEA
jgi:hypothetical protein